MDEESDDMAAQNLANNLSPAAAAWRVWLEENGPRLFLFARQQTRSREDAEDVLQDAIVRLVDKLRTGEFVGDRDAWMPYLYTSIRRIAIDLGRKEDRRQRREDRVSADLEELQSETLHPWFDSGASNDESRQQLERALRQLPAKLSEVIVMKIWGERTFAEIGETLEISQNTAASRYRYGIEALRKLLSAARAQGDL